MSKRLTASQRRAQLIDVGRGVFAKNGYEATSVEEIARAAGVSKPIVYQHFGGKEGLHAVIVDREMEQVVDSVARAIAKGSPRSRFQAAVRAFLEYVQQHPDGFVVLARDTPTTGDGMSAVVADLGERISQIFAGELEKAGHNARHAPIYAHALIGMVTATGRWWMEQDGDFDLDEVAAHVAALGWMGLRHLPDAPDPVPT
ncbi:MAG: TetR/AcrR family transcriptional regulator [Myxococcota bacterium]|nr:TetR/AcrR family transcriptional regulator [Myxococcota bacterium]